MDQDISLIYHSYGDVFNQSSDKYTELIRNFILYETEENVDAGIIIDTFEPNIYYYHNNCYEDSRHSLYHLSVLYNKINILDLLIKKKYCMSKFLEELGLLIIMSITHNLYDIVELLLKYVHNFVEITYMIRYAKSLDNPNSDIIELLEAHIL